MGEINIFIYLSIGRTMVGYPGEEGQEREMIIFIGERGMENLRDPLFFFFSPPPALPQ